MRKIVVALMIAVAVAVLALINSSLPTEADARELPNSLKWTKARCEIVVYPGGAGVRYCGNREHGTYPAGTFF